MSSEEKLCRYCGLPVDNAKYRKWHKNIAHGSTALCVVKTRASARAWQHLRDFLNGTPEEWLFKIRQHLDWEV